MTLNSTSSANQTFENIREDAPVGRRGCRRPRSGKGFPACFWPQHSDLEAVACFSPCWEGGHPCSCCLAMEYWETTAVISSGFPSSFLVFRLIRGFCYVAPNGLELSMQSRVALDSQKSFCLSTTSARITVCPTTLSYHSSFSLPSRTNVSSS